MNSALAPQHIFNFYSTDYFIFLEKLFRWTITWRLRLCTVFADFKLEVIIDLPAIRYLQNLLLKTKDRRLPDTSSKG
jgi:hypothetical protein